MFVVDTSCTQPGISETSLAGLRVLLPAGETRQNSADTLPQYSVTMQQSWWREVRRSCRQLGW